MPDDARHRRAQLLPGQVEAGGDPADLILLVDARRDGQVGPGHRGQGQFDPVQRPGDHPGHQPGQRRHDGHSDRGQDGEEHDRPIMCRARRPGGLVQALAHLRGELVQRSLAVVDVGAQGGREQHREPVPLARAHRMVGQRDHHVLDEGEGLVLIPWFTESM